MNGKSTGLTRVVTLITKNAVTNGVENKIGGITMNFLSITSSDDMWEKVSQFAQSCSWRAGKSLSQNMSDNTFSDWERVIVALHENDIAGYCTVAKSDCIPNVSYTPYIGYMFVDKKYRGQHLSQKLIFMRYLIYGHRDFIKFIWLVTMKIFTKSMVLKSLTKKWRLGENWKKSICVRYKNYYYSLI